MITSSSSRSMRGTMYSFKMRRITQCLYDEEHLASKDDRQQQQEHERITQYLDDEEHDKSIKAGA